MTFLRRFAAALLLFVVAALGIAGGEPFRGNTRSRVFHQSSCRYYTCSNCTARFATVKDAVANGYRPCAVCEPAGSSHEAAADAAYVGNTSTHKFHRGSCRYAGCSSCTARFKSRDEAVAAGYRAGGCCRP